MQHIDVRRSRQKYLLLHIDNGCGWHFFDWSLQYLSGKTKNFYFENKKYQDLLANPLEDNKAHKYQPNIVHSVENLISINDQIDCLSNDSFPVVLESLINTFTLNKSNIDNHTLTKPDVENALIDLAVVAKRLGFTIITIDWSNQHKYVPVYQLRLAIDYKTGRPIDSSKAYQSWMETFFDQAIDKFNSTTWDQRECMALHMRSTVVNKSSAQVVCEAVPDVILYSTEDVWYHAQNIFQNVDQERFRNWLPIYNNWQSVHDVALSTDYHKILDAIVNGQSMDLTPYNLDLIKEAFIQHGLIFKHNLNLKNWQLEKFPNNTKELHQLLEENFHHRDLNYCENF